MSGSDNRDASPSDAGKPDRRQLLVVSGAAAIVVATGGVAYALSDTKAFVRRLLRAEFGANVVRGRDSERFIHDISESMQHQAMLLNTPLPTGARFHAAIMSDRTPAFNRSRKIVRVYVITNFLKRTNAYRVYVGEDRSLIYGGSIDPAKAPCMNFLSAQFRPRQGSA